MSAEQKIWRGFRKALKAFPLLADGDKILIALSGGKDSLLLTELLGRQSHIFKPRISVEAVHVRMANIAYETDTLLLEQFCQQWNIPLHIINTQFSASESNASPCFLCSWTRRKAIFQLAQELGCNKIALGHHMDDILHTTLLNLFYEGRFGTMPAVLKMQKMPLTLIRPLCMIQEKDILTYSTEQNYPQQKKLCPHEHHSQREEMKQLFHQIEALNPETRYALWHALERDEKLMEE